MKPTKALVCLAAVGVLLPTPAFAYLDPGTLGMLVQLLVGAIAGSLVFLRWKWTQVKSFFSRKQPPFEPPVSGGSDEKKAEGD